MIVSFFPDVYSRSPSSIEMTIDSLIDVCRESSQVEREPSETAKRTAMMLNVATYQDGGIRSLDDAVSAEFVALDLDAGDWTVFAAQAFCRAAMTPFILYTTTKSQPDQQRFRLMLFFDRIVRADEYRSVWEALDRWIPAEIDRATSDITRLSAMPYRWRGAFQHFGASPAGRPIDVDALLEDYAPPLRQPRTMLCLPTGEVGSAYAAAALRNEVEAVRLAMRGNRNKTVFDAAFSLGQLIGAGVLDRSSVAEALRQATSLSPREADVAIANGIKAGMRCPRRLS